MVTLSPHVSTLATVLAARHLAGAEPVAIMALATQAAGGMTLGVVVLTVTVLAAAARALRGIFELIAKFVQVAATMAAVLVVMLLAIVLTVAVLVHH